MPLLKTFNAQSDYGFKQIHNDGSVISILMTGTVPADLTPAAFADAAKNPATEVSVTQKRGKLKQTGREMSAKRTEITGDDAAALFAELMAGPAPVESGTIGADLSDAERSAANGRLQPA